MHFKMSIKFDILFFNIFIIQRQINSERLTIFLKILYQVLLLTLENNCPKQERVEEIKTRQSEIQMFCMVKHETIIYSQSYYQSFQLTFIGSLSLLEMTLCCIKKSAYFSTFVLIFLFLLSAYIFLNVFTIKTHPCIISELFSSTSF